MHYYYISSCQSIADIYLLETVTFVWYLDTYHFDADHVRNRLIGNNTILLNMLARHVGIEAGPPEYGSHTGLCW